MCEYWRSLIVVVCTMFLILAVIIMGDNAIGHHWDKIGWRMVHLSSFWLVAYAWNLHMQ